MFKSSNKIISAYGITILSTVVGTVCGLSMTILMAYPLSRRDLPGRNGLAFYVFFTMLFSGGLVPTYIMYTRYIKVSNTIWALIIPSLVVNAFYVIMMRTYFSTNIPEAVIEAARIDGCGWYSIFAKILLPMIVPALVTVAVLTFIASWGDFMGSLLYLNTPQKYTAAYALKLFADAAFTDYGATFAMSVVSLIPILILFFFFQKNLVEGISTQGIKG